MRLVRSSLDLVKLLATFLATLLISSPENLASNFSHKSLIAFILYHTIALRLLCWWLLFRIEFVCSTACTSTWDFVCYIENFCVAHLLKFAMVAILCYLVLLFVYLIFNLGICQCICRSLCRITWACFATCFSAFHFSCSYLCFKLRTVKRTRRRRKRDIEELATPSGSEDEYELEETRHPSGNRMRSRRRNHKNEHLRRSLRPTSHRARLELSGNSVRVHRKKIMKSIGDGDTSPLHHHIRVSRSSKFLQRGSRHNRTRRRHVSSM